MSLKSILHKEIREKGFISTSEMEAICKRENKKISNGERRLRKSESPSVEAVENDKGAIIGYKWVGLEVETKVEKYPDGQLGFTYKVHDPITSFRDHQKENFSGWHW